MVPVLDLALPYVEEARVEVDGRADEDAWGDALVLDGLRTFSPEYGEAPTGALEVRLLSDAHALFLHFRVVDPEPSRVRASLGRRDTRWSDDFVGLYLDPQGDGQRAYLFAANPLGVQGDGTRVSGAMDDDLAWDGMWASAGQRTEEGYEVEVAVPWRSIRHPVRCERLGLLVFRHVARNGERSSWPELAPDVQGMLVQQGLIRGPGTLPRTASLDLIPELAFGWTEAGPTDERLGVQGLYPGLTLRWSPSPSTSLLGTVNPDFSQVESDSAQVDVNRRYALHYDEKRPFFLEGKEWFSHPWEELVYTRSMVSPLYGARGTAELDEWTLAAMHVLDTAPAPSVSEGGGWTEEDLEDRSALATLLRARRNVGRDGHLGLLLSDRTVLGSDVASRMGGLDLRMRLSDHAVGVATVLASATRFEEGAPVRAAPAALAFAHYEGERAFLGGLGNAIGPDFRAENGFVTEADRLGGALWGGLMFRPGWKVLPLFAINPLESWVMWNTQGDLRDLAARPYVWLQFGNGVEGVAFYEEQGQLFEGVWLANRRAGLELEGGWTRWLEAGVEGSWGTGPYFDAEDPRVGDQGQVGVELVLKPAPPISLGMSVDWEVFSEQGEILYDGWVGRARLDLFATRSLWARVIGDWSTFDEFAGGEVLVAWERAPGRAIYLGGRVADEDELHWQLMAKASWVIAI